MEMAFVIIVTIALIVIYKHNKKVGEKKAEKLKQEQEQIEFETYYDYSTNDLQKETAKGDEQLALLLQLDKQYQTTGDINATISGYELILPRCNWNCFNQYMKLVSMYLKAGRNNDAWGLLNQMSIDTMKGRFPHYENDMYKIKFEQFRILKREKKNNDAIAMLASSFVYSPSSFDRDDFIKQVRILTKGTGIDDSQIEVLTNEIANEIINGEAKEENLHGIVKEFFSGDEGH